MPTTLLAIATEASIVNSKFPSLPFNIPNGHAILGDTSNLEALAKALGIDYSKTISTYRVVTSKSGSTVVYSLNVANIEGAPTLSWGSLNVPLSALKVQPSVLNLEGRTLLEFTVKKGVYAQVALTLKKDALGAVPKFEAVRAALDTDNLSSVLGDGLILGAKLHTIAPLEGEALEFEVVAYLIEVSKFGPTAKVKLEGLGWFDGNTSILNALASNPGISETNPATLSIRPVTRTHNGNPVVDTQLHLSAANGVEVFDFAA